MRRAENDVAPWGEPPTPLLPSLFRQLLLDQPAPRSIRRWAHHDLLCRDLDRNVWNYASAPLPDESWRELGWLVEPCIGSVRDLVAVPRRALPDDLESLPLRPRSRRAVLRGRARSPQRDWPADATVGELIELLDFGVQSLLEVLCLLESAADRPNGIVVDPPRLVSLEGVRPRRPRPKVVHRPRPRSVREEIEAFIGSLDDRRQLVLRRRILATAPTRPTLAEIGRDFHVTRERVRQIEKRTVVELAGLGDGLARRRGRQLGRRLGTAVPLDSDELASGLEWATADLGTEHREVVGSLMLYLAGPYREERGWLVSEPSVGRLVRARALLLKAASEDGVLSPERSTRILARAGIAPEQHARWIDHLGIVRGTARGLVRWDGSRCDKIYRLLRQRGIPATAAELAADLDENLSPRLVQIQMVKDRRFVRIDNRSRWTLREWAYEPYHGIVAAIAGAIERAGGGVDLALLCADLEQRLGVRESSVRSSAKAPMFLVENGHVRLRGADEPYVVVASVTDARGCFQLSATSASWLVALPARSNHRVPVGLATFLGLVPGGQRGFRVLPDDGSAAAISMVWRTTSHSGASLGSLRLVVERAGARRDCPLRLVLDRAVATIRGSPVPPPDDTAGDARERISTLTGLAIGRRDPTAVLARGLGVAPGVVQQTLRSRGDEVIAGLLAEHDRRGNA